MSEFISKINDHGKDYIIRDAAAAPIESPNLRGVPTAPTAAQETKNDQIATTAFVHGLINNNIDSKLGNPGGIATLDENGNIPSSQLPSYVDDVLDGTYDKENDKFLKLNGEIYSPESSKIYIDVNTRVTYRWTGTTYAEIASSLALGTTAATAFPGNRGLALEQEVAALSQGTVTYRGTIGTDGDITELPTTYKRGDMYRVVTEGTYSEQECEVGDFLFCTRDNILTVATLPSYDTSRFKRYIIYQKYNPQTGANGEIIFAAYAFRMSGTAHLNRAYYDIKDNVKQLYSPDTFYVYYHSTTDNGVTWTALNHHYGDLKEAIFIETETEAMRILNTVEEIYNNENAIIYSPNPWGLSGYATDWAVIQGNLEDVITKADIVDNLNSDDANVPLSARQGKILKDTIDNAVIYQGTIGENGNITTLPVGSKKGDMYQVVTKGTYAGQDCDIGDFLLCIKENELSVISLPNDYDTTIYDKYVVYQEYNPVTDVYGVIHFAALKNYYSANDRMYYDYEGGSSYKRIYGMGDSYTNKTIDNGMNWIEPDFISIGFAKQENDEKQFIFLYSNINIYNSDNSIFFTANPWTLPDDFNTNWAVIQGKLEDMIGEGAIYIDPDETSTEIENVDSVTSAKLVSYSNENSGLEATNVQDAIDEVNEKTDDINTYLQRNSSSKNLLKPTIASHTYGGVTITVNSDKSITLNGITNGVGLVTIGQVQLEADTEYIYSVNPSENMPDGWFSQVTHRDGQSFVNVSTYGEDITFTNAGAALKSFIYFYLGVSGTVYNNITFYPMIRLSSIEDDTYQPYYEDTMSSVNYLNDEVNYLSNKLSTVSTSVNSLKYNALERTDVVDNLLSTATDKPLSANQGRDINERLNAHSERFEVLYERSSFSVVKMGKIVRLVGAIELTNTTPAWTWLINFKDIADKYKPLSGRTIKDVSQLYTFELNRWGYVQTAESLPAGNYYFDVAWLIP